MNTPVFLAIASSIVPDRPAVIFEGERTTYAGLEERVKKLAGSMSGLGVREGDNVAMMNVNGPWSIEAYFAAAMLGAVYAPLDYHVKAEELEFLLSNTRPVLILAG
ncbi:AMP-binding protein, partial [Candidatus Woesearchaeota archaeon]|nr:AMP-binding protein [Candidatus Woesearchaeota archaeon]